MSELGIVGPDDIDADWLTAAIRSSGSTPADAWVTAVHATPIGTGQMGSSVRYRLTWNRSDRDLPTSVVGKFPSHDERSRAAGAAGIYARELGFYRDLQPHLDVPTPRPLHVAFDEATAAFTLLMTDVHPAHQGDQLAGCTLADAVLAAETISTLHAATWGRADELARLSWLPTPGPELLAEQIERYRGLFVGFARDLGGRLDEDELALGRWIGDRFPAIALAHRLPRCVVHNDYRLDNLLFGDDATVAPLTVVDWQTTGLGIGPVDVAYFVGTGLAAEPAAAHEEHLVTRYWHRLVGLGVDVSLDDVWHSYRLGAASGYVMAVIASQLVVRTERGDEMFATMARRSCRQARRVGLTDLVA